MIDYNMDLLMAACITSGFGLSCLFHLLMPRKYSYVCFFTMVLVVLVCYSFLPNF